MEIEATYCPSVGPQVLVAQLVMEEDIYTTFEHIILLLRVHRVL